MYESKRYSLHVKLLLMLQIMHFLFSVRQNVSFFHVSCFYQVHFSRFLGL